MNALSEADRALLDRFSDGLWLNDGLARNTLESYRRDISQFAAWLRESQGRALWRNGEGVLHVVPQGSPSVYAAVEDGDTVWLATSKGAYTLRDGQFEIATPPDWDVRDVRRVGGRLWLRTHNRGVFIADDGQLVRVTEGFVEIEKIVEAGGAVWLVRAIKSFGGSAGGPAFRVDGWMVRELPRRAAVVGNEALRRDALVGLDVDLGGLLDQFDGNLRYFVLVRITTLGDPGANEVLVEACRARACLET